MKVNLLIIILSLSGWGLLQAQAPQAFSFQAIARTADGKPLSTQTIGLQAIIHQDSPQGTVVYKELHKDIETSVFGLFALQIGRGKPGMGIFDQIDWAQGPYFLEIGIDPDNGNTYALSSVTEMISVPYALYAERYDEKDGDPTNELQSLSLVGNTLVLSNGGGTVLLPSGSGYTAGNGIQIANQVIINTGDIDATNDITNTTSAGGSLVGTYPNPQIAPNAIGSMEILNGSITLSDIAIGVVPKKLDDLDDVNTSGVVIGQVLKWNGSMWVAAVDNTGGTGQATINSNAPIIGDGSISNPVTIGQNGATNGQILKWNGVAWAPANDNVGSASYVAGAGININGNTISAIDQSPTNELQTISLVNNTLNLSNNGGMVSLTPYLQNLIFDTTTQTLQISGGNTINLSGFGASLWKKLGIELEPQTANLGLNIPSGNFRGGGAKGWEFQNGGSGIQFFKPSGNYAVNVSIGSVQNLPNNGSLSIFNAFNKQSVYEFSCEHNAGEVWAQSPTGKINVDIGHELNFEEGRIDIFGPTVLPSGGVARLFSRGGIGNLSLLNQNGILLLDANQSSLDEKGGAIRVYSNDQPVGRLYAANGDGALLLSAQSGYDVITAGKNGSGMGEVNIWEPGGNVIGTFNGCGHGVGSLSLFAPSGKLIVDASHTGYPNSENGFIGVYNKTSDPYTAVTGFWTTDSIGTMFTNNIEANQIILDNNNTNIWHTTIWDDADGGFEMIRNSSGGTPKVYLYVENDSGVVAADQIIASVKNFRMDHPNDPTKEIYYASIEGPEAAAYERGVGQLINGEAFIPYSEDFGWVINPATVTVQLTPNNADTYGLAVIEKAEGGFRVRELKGGKGSFTFDWEAKAVRKGYENYKVIRPKSAKLHQPAQDPQSFQRKSAHRHEN